MANIIVIPLRTFSQYIDVSIQLGKLEIKEIISNDDVELARMLVDQFERDYIKNYKNLDMTLFNVQRMPLEHTLDIMLKEIDTEDIIKKDICLSDILKQNIRLVELMLSFNK